jgi:nitrite reductase/ring-hydroxylating ferredoxin subunit
MAESLTYHAVASTGDLSDGEMIAVTIGKKSIALYQVDGKYFATDALCTHGHALLTDGYIEDGRVECPMHGGSFEIASGKPTGEPCVTALATYAVRIDGEQISVGLPPPG